MKTYRITTNKAHSQFRVEYKSGSTWKAVRETRYGPRPDDEWEEEVRFDSKEKAEKWIEKQKPETWEPA